MSAKDDYPKLNATTCGARHQGQTSREAQAALKEIDQLRRWKAEATEVLKRWDAVAERFDLSGHLGESTADAVGVEIDWLLDHQR